MMSHWQNTERNIYIFINMKFKSLLCGLQKKTILCASQPLILHTHTKINCCGFCGAKNRISALRYRRKIKEFQIIQSLSFDLSDALPTSICINVREYGIRGNSMRIQEKLTILWPRKREIERYGSYGNVHILL